MSLFKLKSVWTKVFSEEEFDERHLAVGKIGRQAVIAVGNFAGLLRVFMIYKNKEIEVRSIYENKFEGGIVDVKFVAHPDERIRNGTIGILFFRKFAYLNFESTNGENLQPKLLYVDVEPSFGIGSSPISVMTLNSTIQYLNPRQIQKIKVSDPIYPYTRSMNKIYFVDGEELVQIEGSVEQWRIIVGRIRQLFVFIDTIVVIGEKALWEVCNAKIIKTKVMDEDISCGSIALKNINAYNILVANYSCQLFIYTSNYELLWAMKLDYVPIRIIINEHEEIKGMMTILSEDGNLQLAYSGVEIPDSVIEPLSQTIDYAIVEAETQQFLEKMKNKPQEKVNKVEAASKMEGGYKLYFGEIEKSYQSLQEKDRLYKVEGKLVKCQLICEIKSRETLRNFKIQLNLPFNLYTAESNKEMTVAKFGQKIVFPIFTNNQQFPYDRQLSVIIYYENNDQRGPAVTKMESIAIPMGLQCSVTGFESTAKLVNTITIKSNQQLPAFNDIFPELLSKETQEQRKTLKLTLSNGVDCIITYNKKFNRVKLESQYYSGLCYGISEYANHIRLYNAKKGAKIELSVQIPLEEFFSIMKDHYQHRNALKQAFKDVEVKSEEFRNTQKKLLIKMKEKMNNLGNIDKLLEYTYERLMDSATRFEEVSTQMEIINHNLCVAIRFIIELLFIRANPSLKAKQMALGIIAYQKESMERGWQDKVLANSSHFLNKKYNRNDQISFEQLQKIPLYVISKVNNGDWN